MKIRRRITLQLTPLLDLLLVVIFAQYIHMEQTAGRQVEAAASEAQVRIDAIGEEIETARKERSDADIKRLQAFEELKGRDETLTEARGEISALRTRVKELEISSEEQRRQHREDLTRLGRIAANLLRIDPVLFAETMESLPADEVRGLKEGFEDLRGKSAEALIRHLREIDAIRKRCDLWEVHIETEGRILFRFTGADEADSFWAGSSEDFVLKAQKGIARAAEPKSLVLILFSYSDATWGARQPVEEGVDLLKIWLRKEFTGKAFHVARMGYSLSPP